MDELYQIINILFRKILPQWIADREISYDKIPIGKVEQLFYADQSNRQDETEIQRMIQSLKNEINFQMYEDGKNIEDVGNFNIFDLIDIFVDRVLEEKQDEIVCRFKYLQEWRRVTNKVDSIVFLSAMHAKTDYKNGKHRKNFIWSDIIGHDNIQLNRILSSGISDNHFHLLGSVHYFSLSWIMLMNHVDNPEFQKAMTQMDRQRQNPRIRISYDYQEQEYKIQHLQAALVRLYLFAKLTGHYIEIGCYRAPWEKVILQIIKNSRDISELIEEYTKILSNCSDDKEIEIRQLRKVYPEYFWLFDKIWSSDSAIKQIKKVQKLQEENNIFEGLIQEAKNDRVKSTSLRECAWIYRNHMSLYDAEWWKQTEENVWKLLKDNQLLLKFRLPMQKIIDGFIDRINRINCDYVSGSSGEWYDTDEMQGMAVGERWLEYMIFHEKYSGNNMLSEMDYNLFYMYLLVKEAFRMELQQSNDRLGFNNFHKYQKRKGMFTSYYTYGELARIAVEDSMKNQRIESLEIRIGFGQNCNEDSNIIQYYDQEIQKGKVVDIGKYYYVMGFGKRKDNFKKASNEYQNMFYRHYDFRNQIRKETNGLIELRRRNPELAKRIRGVDAFSHEDGCRPEVFATVYRVLKKHSCYQGLSSKPELPQLRETYHVGETFIDILDGLRSIDEAVCFLNLDCGDRLGHATVLGMDAEQWYKDCNYKVSMRRQEYLDNVVWLYHKLLQYHIPDTDTLMQYLESEFEKYFALIYRKFIGEKYIENVARAACTYSPKYASRYSLQTNSTNSVGNYTYDFRYGIVRKNDGSIYDFNIRNYYYSWMLRGDHPGLYENGYYEKHFNIKSIWDECSINREFPKDQRIRYILPAAILNHFYHYNPYVKETGEAGETVIIPTNMVKAISQIQKAMQFELAQREIAIETNPSSNLMINRISTYDKHPIFKLYNMGLVHDSELLEACPQMNVSINTDDQGVFGTCLANEYALVASALARLKDSDGKNVYKKADIYQWIKNVQEMGNNQSFLKGENLERGIYAGVCDSFDRSQDGI